MTTPQLNVLKLKRSKLVKHYCYLAHAPMDVHANKLFSFDYFDSVLCGNDYHIENLRFLEKIRGTKSKVIEKVGCTYYDNISEEKLLHSPSSILIAPTWGDRTFLKHLGIPLIESLLKKNYEVILRPHPQSWISDKELLNSIITLFGSDQHFSVDRNDSNIPSLQNAKLIICDVTSGIIYDFALLYERPVIGIEQNWDQKGYEAYYLSTESCAKQFLRHYGAIINESTLESLPSKIESLTNSEIDSHLLSEHVANFKHAGTSAASTILKILKTIS